MKKEIALLEHAPVGQAIVRLAFPSVLAMMVQVIYGLTDTFFIGQMQDPTLVASVSLVLPFVMLLQGIGNIFAFGGGAYISQKLGAKQSEKACQICASSFYLSVIAGGGIALICRPLLGYILPLLGTSAATWLGTQTYLSILMMCSFIQIPQIVLAGLIRAEGATRTAMQGILVGTGLNIVLDYLFIMHWHGGIAGAAWATVLGNAAGVCYYLFYFMYSKTLLSIRWRHFRPTKTMLKNVIMIGLPVALNTLIMSVSHVLTNHVAISYGEITMAASGIMGRLLAIGIFIQMGIAQGYQPFAGYNYGAGRFDRLKQGFKVALGLSTLVGIVIASMFFVIGAKLVGIFIDNLEVISRAVIMINAFVWGLPLFAFNFYFKMAIRRIICL